jgi:acyl-CoA thioesterase
MTVTQDLVSRFGSVHGGAVFSLIEEALQVACNARGAPACALHLSVTTVSAAAPGDRLVAEANEGNLTKRTGAYDIRVTNGRGELVALAQALAIRKVGPPRFS